MVALLVGTCAHAVSLGFTESLYPEPNTFAYWVTITEDVIDEFPTPELEGAPVFHSGCGDGPKPADQTISFRTRASRASVLRIVRAHVRAHDFVEVAPREGDAASFTRGNEALSLTIHDVGALSGVSAELTPGF
jgi:hypothetical protein